MIRLKPGLKKAIERRVSIFRVVKPKQKPVRTSKNPVRVVFVCPFGGSSNALSNAFLAALRKKGVNSVVSTSFASKGKTPSELSSLLANADFVIPRSDMMISRRRLRAVGPKGSNVLRSYPNKEIASAASTARVLRPMTLDVERETDRILKAVGKRFQLEP